MNKGYKILIGVSILLFLIYIYISQATDIFKFYQNPTTANEPNLSAGSVVLVSSLIEPKRLDFVSYKHEDAALGKHKRIHRLVGTPGDTIKIENGNLYVNTKNVDQLINPGHFYSIPLKLAKKIEKELVPLFNDQLFYYSANDTAMVILSNSSAEKHKLQDALVLSKPEDVDQFIFSKFNKEWNMDYFGPLILKENEYFVMGDNRGNSEDSRALGIIPKSKLVGKVISL